MDVLSLDKDETHDVEVTLDQDAGLLRLLVTLSDSRLAPGQSQGHGDDGSSSAGSRQPIGQPLARPANHSAASAKYAVSKNNRLATTTTTTTTTATTTTAATNTTTTTTTPVSLPLFHDHPGKPRTRTVKPVWI